MANGQAHCVLRHVRTILAAHDADQLSDRELLRRFHEWRDEAAFTALVRRHGPMVLGVCRRVLPNPHDADDAFQAAFFTLARKAGARTWHESVGPWLHLVAHRLALRIRSEAERRSRHESRATTRPADDPLATVTGRELCAVIDDELSALPERLRAPLVLCCLEGETRDEAARNLGWSLATLKRRLDQGRERLRLRLQSRGFALPAAFAGLLAGEQALAGLPAALIHQTVGAASAGVPASARIAVLSQEIVKRTLLTKGIAVASVLLAVCTAIGVGTGLALTSSPAEDQPPPAKTAAPQDLKKEKIADSLPPKVDLHGDPLPPEALVRLGTTRLRHGEDINSLHFTPDGKVLVARGKGGVRTWETATGKRIHVFPKESEGDLPPGPSLSPNGKLFATPGEKMLYLWDTATANLLRTINLDQEFPLVRLPVSTCCFSPDGKLLASPNGNSANDVTLWNPATGEQIRRWTVGNKRVMFLAFAGDSKTLITASQDHSIRIWNTATGEKLLESAGLPDIVQALALSPDGKLLAMVGFVTKPRGPGVVPAPRVVLGDFHYPEPFVRIWDVAARKELRRFIEPGHEKKADEARGFESLAFTPDGKTLLAGAVDGALYACALLGDKEPRRVWRDSARISAIAASPNSKTAAVADGPTIHLIDLAGGKDVFPITGHPQHVYKTAITPNGRTAVTASGADLYLWDVASGRLRKRLQGHHDYINGLVLIDGGRKAVTSAYQEGTLRVWDLVAEKEAYRIESSDKANILQAVSPDGKTIAVGGSNSLTVLFDTRTGKEIQRLKGYGKFNDYGAAFTPDGRMLVVWYSEDNMVYLWDLASGKKVREYIFVDGDPPPPNPVIGGRPVYFAAVSPDGRLIAFGSQSRFFEVRDLATGEVFYRQTKRTDGVCPMTFSPDSRTLAWSGWWNDPTVHLVEIATGKDRRQFAGHTGGVLSLSFSADGTKLISGSGDTTALVWDLTGKLAAGDDWGKPLSAKDIETTWEDLAAEDSVHAYDAIRRLSAAPREPVAFLRQHLKPVAAPDEKRLAQLITDLDAEEFMVREKATQELEGLGEAAVEACRKAIEGKPSAESRRRLERLLSKQTRETGQPSAQRLRLIRALEILERARSPEARQLLEALAHGAPGAGVTREAKASLRRLQQPHPAP